MRRLGFEVQEVMEGTLQRPGENFSRPFRFDLRVVFASMLHVLTAAVGRAWGTVRVDGLARDTDATGSMELSPLLKGRVRYTFDFAGDDGRRYHFDGWKTLRRWNVFKAWTTLPGSLYDDDGKSCGKATLYFSFRRHFPGLLRSFRLRWERPGSERAPEVATRAA